FIYSATYIYSISLHDVLPILTISNNLLKYMGTNLMLESETEKGSVFYFDIEVPYEMNDVQENDGDMSEIGRVLVVDDNQNNRTIIHHMLEYKNIKSEVAAKIGRASCREKV